MPLRGAFRAQKELRCSHAGPSSLPSYFARSRSTRACCRPETAGLVGRVLREENPPRPGRTLLSSATPRRRRSSAAACASTAGPSCSRAATAARPSCPATPRRACSSRRSRYKNVDLQMPQRRQTARRRHRRPDRLGEDGRPWGKDDGPAAAVPDKPAFDLQKRKHDHWAWQPIRPTEPPAVKDAAWPRGPVDRFILAKLEEKDLTPAPPADQRTLLRRVYFRPDRPAADAGGGRGLRQGRIAGRLREGGGPAAGVAAVRRALGAALARPGALRARRAATSSTTPSPTPTSTAITSSAPSTPTCPTTSS